MHFLIKHEIEFLSVENGFELDPVPTVGGAPEKLINSQDGLFILLKRIHENPSCL
jgi:hypothetical protein